MLGGFCARFSFKTSYDYTKNLSKRRREPFLKNKISQATKIGIEKSKNRWTFLMPILAFLIQVYVFNNTKMNCTSTSMAVTNPAVINCCHFPRSYCFHYRFHCHYPFSYLCYYARCRYYLRCCDHPLYSFVDLLVFGCPCLLLD